MATINLCKLTEILKSVINRRDYRSPRAFLESKIFNEKYDVAVNCMSPADDNAKPWMDLSDSNVISELVRGELKHNLRSTKITYAVTKLIIYHYNGILFNIEQDIASDLAELSDEQTNLLICKLNKLKTDGEIPLCKDLEFTCENLAKAVVACVLHCFYIDNADIRRLGNAYSKDTVIALKTSGVTQEQFERDFPEYAFRLAWDKLAVTKDCKYTHCERCKHKCAEFRSNYNVERLINLYLEKDVEKRRTAQSEQTKEGAVAVEDMNVLNAILAVLSSETKSQIIRKFFLTRMSAGETLEYAFELLMQEKKDDKNKN